MLFHYFSPKFILPYLDFLKIWQLKPNKDTWPVDPQPPCSRDPLRVLLWQPCLCSVVTLG